MGRILLSRLLNVVLVVAGVAIIVFLLFAVLPADPARMVLGQRADSASVAMINRELGLDQPIHRQFLLFVNDLSPVSVFGSGFSENQSKDKSHYGKTVLLFSTGDREVVLKAPYLRKSYQSCEAVTSIILAKLPDTFVLALASILIAVLLGIVLGIFAALYRDTPADRFIIAISLAGIAIPSFFSAILFAWIFGFLLGPLTGLNMTGGLYEIDAFLGAYIEWKNLLLPALVLGLRPMAIITQLMRASLLDVLSHDYIRTARAKGMPSRIIVIRHALSNAWNPVVVSVSGWLGSLLAGAVFIEYIFGWNGIGKLTVTALENYDLPVVTGIVLFVSVVFIFLNIFADMINALLDPRIRQSAGN